MVERVIGYIVTVGVLLGMGVGLPRWFQWRRSLIDRVLQRPEDVGHV